jgi:pilus assembly protein TadC
VSVNVGNYKAGDTITSQDSIVDILTHLLTKVIDVVVVPPTASLLGSGDKSVLYGTSIQPTLTITLKDGTFESEDKVNYNYSQKLGTVLEGASIKKSGNTLSTTNTISGNTI